MRWRDDLHVQLHRSVVKMNELTQVAAIELAAVFQVWHEKSQYRKRIEFNKLVDQHSAGRYIFSITCPIDANLHLLL